MSNPIITVADREVAHKMLDEWLAWVERECPDYGDGEQALLRFRAGLNDGYFTIIVKRSMEKTSL